MAARLATAYIANLCHRGTVGAELVRDDYHWITIPFHRFSEEFQGCSWWCQANTNQSPKFAHTQVLGYKKVAPFAKRGVPVGFEG
jgi:hypothetical protein